MAASKLITPDWSNLLGTSSSSPRAASHYIPFSQALMAASKQIASDSSKLLGTSSSSPKDASHYKPFSHALIAALQLTTLACANHHLQQGRAPCQCLPFSHALMAPLYDNTLRIRLQHRSSFKSSNGNTHSEPFSHALMAAL